MRRKSFRVLVVLFWILVFTYIVLASIRLATAQNCSGYIQADLCIPGMVSKSTYYLPPPQYFRTRALYQAENLLEETAALHGLDGTEDYIALLNPVAVGWKAYLQVDDRYIPVRVADASRREDMYMEAVYMHSGLELSYKLAKELGDIDWINPDGSRYRWLNVCITDAHPELACTGDPVEFEQWFLDNLSFERDN